MSVFYNSATNSTVIKLGGGYTLPKTTGTDGYVMAINNTTKTLDFVPNAGGGSGTGNIIGPVSNSLNAFAQYDGTTGKLLKDSILKSPDNDTLTFNTGTLFKKQGSTQLFGCSGTVTSDSSIIINNSVNSGSGNNNTIVGYEGGSTLSTGSGNTIVGLSSGRNTTTGSGNTFVGLLSGRNTTTGSGNTFVGLLSGLSIIEANSCTMVGRKTNGTASSFNQIAIGYQATTTKSNQCMIGNSNLSEIVTGGSCNLGTNARPFNSLALKEIITGSLLNASTNKAVIQYDSTINKPVYSDGVVWHEIGDISVSVRSVAVSDNILANDYMINASAAITLSLPDVTTVIGQTFIIIKETGGSVTLTTSIIADKIFDGEASDSIIMNGVDGERIQVKSNGNRFYVF